jgi:arylformamidase
MDAALYREFRSQSALDEQYDVERSVPDFTLHARHYIDESKLARHRLRCELDVSYGATRDEYLDIFPADRRDAPILLFIHGGYWRMLSAKEFSCVALGPVAAGVTVVVVNYALCPHVSIDEIVRQARAAVAWTYRNARSFGGDPNRLFVSGHSAGGQLTAMCLNTDWEGVYGLPADTVRAGLSISGVFDLQPIRYTSMQPMLQLDDGVVVRNSPQRLPQRRTDSPFLFTFGGAETAEFQRQTMDFLHHWQMSGNRGEYVAQPGLNHFDAIYGLEDSRSSLCKALFRMMDLPAGRFQARTG